MKKVIFVLICLLAGTNVFNASSYSKWNTEIPLNNESITIKTEKRYLYYEMVESNIEYKKYDKNEKRLVDLKTFKYSEPYEVYEEVESDETKRVTKKVVQKERFYDDVRYIVFANNETDGSSLRIRDISIINTLTDETIPFTLDRYNNIVSLSSNDFLLNDNGNIILKLDETFNGLYTKIIYTIVRENDEDVKEYSIRYMDNEDNINFSSNKLDTNINTTRYEEIPLVNDCWVQRFDFYDTYVYVVEDKLFKYYELVRKDIGYYKNLEGNYLKDEKPTLFYSYKINEKIKPQIVMDTCENFEPSSEDNENNSLEKNELETNIDKDVDSTPEKDSNLISYNTTKKVDSCYSYKTFSLLCLFGVLFLVLLILVYSMIRIYKSQKD